MSPWDRVLSASATALGWGMGRVRMFTLTGRLATSVGSGGGRLLTKSKSSRTSTRCPLAVYPGLRFSQRSITDMPCLDIEVQPSCS